MADGVHDFKPLFIECLQQLERQASEKNQKSQYTYKRAIQSIKKYPLPLHDARSAKELQYIGDGIVKILTTHLKQHCAKLGITYPATPSPVRAAQQKKAENAAKRKVSKEYVPKRRSGAYAILISLYRSLERGEDCMTRTNLINVAQPLCDVSLTAPAAGARYQYNGWSSMSSLISKNLVIKRGNPARYSLTDEGESLASRLVAAEQAFTTGVMPPSLQSHSSASSHGSTRSASQPSTQQHVGVSAGTRAVPHNPPSSMTYEQTNNRASFDSPVQSSQEDCQGQLPSAARRTLQSRYDAIWASAPATPATGPATSSGSGPIYTIPSTNAASGTTFSAMSPNTPTLSQPDPWRIPTDTTPSFSLSSKPPSAPAVSLDSDDDDVVLIEDDDDDDGPQKCDAVVRAPMTSAPVASNGTSAAVPSYKNAPPTWTAPTPVKQEAMTPAKRCMSDAVTPPLKRARHDSPRPWSPSLPPAFLDQTDPSPAPPIRGHDVLDTASPAAALERSGGDAMGNTSIGDDDGEVVVVLGDSDSDSDVEVSVIDAPAAPPLDNVLGLGGPGSGPHVPSSDSSGGFAAPSPLPLRERLAARLPNSRLIGVKQPQPSARKEQGQPARSGQTAPMTAARPNHPSASSSSAASSPQQQPRQPDPSKPANVSSSQLSRPQASASKGKSRDSTAGQPAKRGRGRPKGSTKAKMEERRRAMADYYAQSSRGATASNQTKQYSHKEPPTPTFTSPPIPNHQKQLHQQQAQKNQSRPRLCDNCDDAEATLRCKRCKEVLCKTCDAFIHQGKKKSLHVRELVQRERSTAATTAAQQSQQQPASQQNQATGTASDVPPGNPAPQRGPSTQRTDESNARPPLPQTSSSSNVQRAARPTRPSSPSQLPGTLTPSSALPAQQSMPVSSSGLDVFSPIASLQDWQQLATPEVGDDLSLADRIGRPLPWQKNSPASKHGAPARSRADQMLSSPPLPPSGLSTARSASAELASTKQKLRFDHAAGTSSIPTKQLYPSTKSGGVDASVELNLSSSNGWCLRPGQYDIVLLVDTMEQTGFRKEKGAIQQKLRDMGVVCDVRKLSLGDFAWVARERVKPVPGQLYLPQPRELVLDYVVERKRMDDFVSSIMDGRFKEQKFRFCSCGIPRPIYLVEEYGAMDAHSIPASRLRQSLVNTQVVDGFFLKHTANIDGSVAYLTLVTRYLTQKFADKVLFHTTVAEGNSWADYCSRPDTYMTLDEFNSLTLKTQRMCVRDQFCRLLLQVHGMTPQRVAAIVDLYPTPKALLAALRKAPDPKKLLQNVQANGRRLGPAISAALSHLFLAK